jgi:multidrug efflux pump subunit AcrA (membrane-fusion protein)
VPALALAYFIFRSRIRTFVRFINTVYLDKKDRVRAWLTPWRVTAISAVLLAVLLVPFWPHYVQARAVLEPMRREVVRNAVPGSVVAVYVREGDRVAPGQSLVRLQDYGVESKRSVAEKSLAEARGTQIDAELNYENAGEAAEQSKRHAVEAATASEAIKRLTPTATIGGTVVGNEITDLRGTYLESGAAVAEIADTSAMRARLFVPEFAVNEVRNGQPIRLLLDGRYKPFDARVAAILPASTSLDAGLEPATSYKGLANARYFVVEAYLPNDGSLRDQMSGTAKIRVGRQSLAGLLGREAQEFIGRKVW